MSRNRALISSAALLVLILVLIGVLIRVQPAGNARVVRRGDELRAIQSRVGWSAPGGQSCFAPLAGSSFRFRDRFDVQDALGEAITTEVTFDYVMPERVPSGWAAGAWCDVLRSRVGELAARAVSAIPVDRLRSNPRDAGALAAQSVQEELRRSGIAPRLLAVRPAVPVAARKTLPVPEIASRAVAAPPVIFLGLDGADWQLLDRYIDAGAMPNLAALVRSGASGPLRTEHPPLSPLLWTTMMTGTSPLEHEILDFTRFNPGSGTKEPITSDERNTPAIWNMATNAGKSVAVFGLWATYPAEPVRGLLVSDRFFTFLFSESTPPPGVVYPASREPWARGVLRQVETAVGYEEVAKFLPWLTREEFDQHKDAKDPYAHPISALRRILVETAVYDRLARESLRDRTPDLTVLYLQGTDSIGHVFAPYMAPRHPKVSAEEFARYSNVPELYFREVDKILGYYREVAEKRGARLMLASDHGFHWFEGRPAQLSSFAAATAAKWHRPNGIYLLAGPGIAAARVRDDSAPPGIAQVCATLLALTGAPAATGAPSPIIVPKREGQPVDYRAHYQRAATVAASANVSAEEIAKLKALGYVGAGESTARPASAGGSTHTAGWYNNRGLILKDRKDLNGAVEAFNRAIELDANLPSALWNLSDLLFAQNRDLDRSDQYLARATAKGLPEGNALLIGRAIGYQRGGSVQRSRALLESAVQLKPDDAELRMFRGRYRVELRDCAGALEDFQAVARSRPSDPAAFASAGVAEMCLGRSEDAQRSFLRSLALDPNQPRLRQHVQQLR